MSKNIQISKKHMITLIIRVFIHDMIICDQEFPLHVIIVFIV